MGEVGADEASISLDYRFPLDFARDKHGNDRKLARDDFARLDSHKARQAYLACLPAGGLACKVLA